MQIIDAHHHLWAPQSPDLDIGYGWLKDIGAPKPFGDPTPIQRDYLIEELAGEAEGLELIASVHLQADPKVPDPVAETAFIEGQAARVDFPVMTIGFADLASDRCADQIAGHKGYASMRGIRQIVSYLPDRPDISFTQTNLLDDLMWRANFAALADHGLRFDLMLYPEQMQQAAALLAENPRTRVVVEHLGSPHDNSEAGMRLWADGMAALAALPGVHAKLSGYALYFGAALEGRAVEVTQEILRLFGPERVMFGSNFPVDRLHLVYTDVVDFVMGQVGDARDQVFRETARQFYDIPV